MGWRDRDWAKFDEDEWEVLMSAPVSAPAGHSLRSRATILLAALVTLGATAAGFAMHFGAKSPPPHAAHANQSSVVVHWSPSDLTLATTAGQVCFNVVAHGAICANYTAGERPADALTRELQAHGLVVQSG